MKHLLLTTIAAVVLVGCGPKAPDISIHLAASMGEHYAVHQHLIAGSDVNAKNEIGMTPLHYAAGSGHERIVEMLIAAGANVNDNMNPDGVLGWTSLHAASADGHYAVVQLLIKNGADINPITSGGATPLDFVEERTRIAKFLKSRGGISGNSLTGGASTESVEQNFAAENKVPFITINRWQDILCSSCILFSGLIASLSTYIASKNENYRLLKSIGTGLAISFIIFLIYAISMLLLFYFVFD
jgi:hypothetical protein